MLFLCVTPVLVSGQQRIYEKDKHGATDYSAGYLEVRKDGTIVKKDKHGATDYSSGTMKIQNGTIVNKDKQGATQYSTGTKVKK